MIMIKIVSIENVGKFLNCSCGRVAFDKLTLIYGENGRGKTTLSSIFRSLYEQNGDHISGRKTLGTSELPKVSILFEGNNRCNFNNTNWDKKCKNIEIFDYIFIDNNVFSGCYVEHDHKKNLYGFIIGEEGCQLAQDINRFIEEIRSKNSKITSLKGEIQKCIIDDYTLENFMKLEQEQNLDKQIANKKRGIEALKKTEDIKNKSSLKEMSIPNIPFERLKTILSKSLDSVSAEAEQKTKYHIKQCMDTAGENWVRNGLGYIKGDKCPFCGQSLEGVALVEAYRDYFSDAYMKLKKDIDQFSREIEGILNPNKLIEVLDSPSVNSTLSEFWKNYIQAEFPEFSANEIKKAWDDISSLTNEHLTRKTASPLEDISLNGALKSAIQEFKTALTKVAHYNGGVKSINKLIDQKKLQISRGSITSLQNELCRLENVKQRFKDNVNKLCKGYDELQKEKDRLDTAKEQKKAELDDYAKNIFPKYQTDIDKYLINFRAGFKIICDTNYIGMNPRLDYHISINGANVKPGDKKTSDGTPSFRNTLSSGDKSALAFAFFLARLDQDPDLANKIIIFDDPISSLDEHRKDYTRQQINRISQLAKQVIVLSHDRYFLCEIWKNAKQVGNKSKNLHIVRKGQSSTIEEWDVEQATREEYFKSYFVLADYLENGPNGDLIEVARYIRPLLEGNLRLRFPKQFGANEELGAFLGKIRNANSNDPLYCLKLVYQELSDINDYSKKYHHNQPGADSKSITDTELQAYVSRTLKLIPGICK